MSNITIRKTFGAPHELRHVLGSESHSAHLVSNITFLDQRAMIARRHQFMVSMRGDTLTVEKVAAVRDADIFIG